MTTPNKLSLKKKHRRAPIAPPGDFIVITDSDDEKENDDKVGTAGSFRTKYRTPRRDSTILAGNMSMLDQSSAVVEAEQQSNVTVRRSKVKPGRGARPAAPRLSCASVMTEDLTIPPTRQSNDKFVSPKSSIGVPGGLVTEDESDFYSCQGSPTNPMNVGLQDTWMTDITTKSDVERRVGQVPPVMKPPEAKMVTPAHAQPQTPKGGSIFKKPQGSTVKAAAFFSVEKRRTVFGKISQNAILAVGSDSDSSPEKRIQPAKLHFTGQLERTVVVPSDDELTEDEDVPVAAGGDIGTRPHLASDSDDDVPLVQLGRDFLSETQFGKIVNWVQDSPFSSKLELSRTDSPERRDSPTLSDEEIESLLKSDPEDGDVRPSWAAPLPDLSVNISKGRSFSERTSKAGGSWNKTGTEVTSTIGYSERTSKAGGSWNKTGTDVTQSGAGDSERTSKAGGSWNKTGTQVTSTIGLSERTSKAGGSWNNSASIRTSKPGDSLDQSDSKRTSKAGGSWNLSVSDRTSKAGGTQSMTTKAGESGNQNQEAIEVAVSSSDLTSNQPGGKSGGNKTRRQIEAKKVDKNKVSNSNVDLDGTLDDFDKLRLSGRGSGGGNSFPGSDVNTSNLVKSTDCNSKSNNDVENKSRKTSTKNISTKSSNYPSTGPSKTSNQTVVSTKTSIVPNKADQSKSATQSSFHLQLSLSQSDDADLPKTYKSLNLDGALSKSQSCSNPSRSNPTPLPPTTQNDGSILQSSYVKARPTTSKPKLPPIENSVNAVRSWNQVTPRQAKPDSDDVRDVWGQLSVGSKEPQSQVSEGVEKCNNIGKGRDGESDSEEDLQKFLTNLKSKKKPPKLLSSDESDDNFVVPDDAIDSDEFNTPKMNLKDRILKRSKPDISSHRKPRVPSPVSDGDSLPDIDSKGSSTNDEEPRDIKKHAVSKPRPGRSVKKVHVVYSDSEDDDDKDTPVHHISSDDDDNDQSFVNIYEPGTYHLVPPPSTPIVIPPTEKKAKPRTKKPKVPAVTGGKTPKSSKVQVHQDNNFSTPTLTFLSSLTIDTPVDRCHPAALPYLKNFPKQKIELASRLYTMYNTQCFENALPEDMEITWNVRLTKTAGLCYSRRHRNRHNIEVRSSRIELSTKVIDSGDRLRDTLIHEMCHAASWIISGYRDGHGPLWRTWAEKAMGRFPELPVIDRCHSYQIRTKYTYRCEKCGYSIGRHSKSLDTDKKVCGHCYGKFQLVVNGKTVQAKAVDGANSAGPSKPKAPNAFALFVKDNYKIYKQPGVSHGDVMKTLSSKFSAAKISK